MNIRAFLALAFLIGAPPVSAQSVSVSKEPSSVSVTVYRDNNRNASQPFNVRWLGGYALITEQRTIDLPAGEVELRFEGVAGGIIPQSAIVTGLPDGVLEKNRDAALLSPSALLNGHLGRRVHLRRTSGATGKVTESEAIIRTDASGGMIVQTEQGYEALQCSGLNETLTYDRVPEGLSDKPTLSVRSRVSTTTRATVTLSYLATGFDWQANYVAKLSKDGKSLNLFAWVTLANGDETSFLNANTQTVAGKPNKERGQNVQRASGGSISLRCWPQGTTSDVPSQFPPQILAAGSNQDYADSDDIVVTAMRRKGVMQEMAAPIAVLAEQEELGDLKLYRIPVPVTVAAQSQKQVAMFEKGNVKFKRIYKRDVYVRGRYDGMMPLIYRFQNDKKNGLGLPLPSGRMTIFAPRDETEILIGEGNVSDKAVDEELEVTASESSLVRYKQKTLGRQGRETNQRLTITNASSSAAKVEIELALNADDKMGKTSATLKRKNGRPLWSVSVPANGKRTLDYKVISNRK